MKKYFKTFSILIILCNLCFCSYIYPQNTSQNTAIVVTGKVCVFSINGYSSMIKSQYITEIAHKNDGSGLVESVNGIEKAYGFNVPISIYKARDENNCFATVVNGERMMVIDLNFLNQINKVSGTNWGAISVIAHELGHHIAGMNKSNHENELNADYWSGYALKKLGASRAVSIKAMEKFGTDFDTYTHPQKSKREKSILLGWDDAYNGKVDYTHCENCR